MREILKFEDRLTDTTVKVNLDKGLYTLTIIGEDKVIRNAVMDKDFDYVSGEFSCFVMGHINEIKREINF